MVQIKILILRFSSIGDMVLTTPVLRCIRQQLPHAEIHYLTKPVYRSLLEHNPNVDSIHVLDKSPLRKGLELRKENFDFVVDLHHNLRTFIIKTLLNTESLSFPKLNIPKFLLVNFKINRLPNKHIVDRYFEATRGLGIENDEQGLDFFIPEQDRIISYRGFLPSAQHYVTWAIGGQHFTKRLPVSKIIEFSKTLSTPVVLLGGKEDEENAEQIGKALGSKCINACGKLNLNQSASMIAQSRRLFTNDTGLMHIAAALRIPVTSFWGNTIPEFGMTPYYGKHHVDSVIIENKNLSCRPCSKIGFDKCPKGHFNCMNQLEINS